LFLGLGLGRLLVLILVLIITCTSKQKKSKKSLSKIYNTYTGTILIFEYAHSKVNSIVSKKEENKVSVHYLVFNLS
jgi:hypothetical protein